MVAAKGVSGHIKIVKVPGTEHLADALTKFVDIANIQFHSEGVRIDIKSDRHEISLKA